MENNAKWLEWAVELQSLAQAGLYYGKDVFDIQRFERVREIAAEMIKTGSELPMEKVKDLFCCESGYQTPKLDCRGAVFSHDKILLVQESNGLWALPGGWVDVYSSIKEGVEKEVKEEAGLTVEAETVIAIQDRKKHNNPPYAYGITKVFLLCRPFGGGFVTNEETLASGYFAMDELPPLSDDKTTKEQIKLCFDANGAKEWKTVFD
ncbi:MAG: NUDIX hydrolase N-terminal domain-containing protein [Christensenellales bacterium]